MPSTDPGWWPRSAPFPKWGLSPQEHQPQPHPRARRKPVEDRSLGSREYSLKSFLNLLSPLSLEVASGGDKLGTPLERFFYLRRDGCCAFSFVGVNGHWEDLQTSLSCLNWVEQAGGRSWTAPSDGILEGTMKVMMIDPEGGEQLPPEGDLKGQKNFSEREFFLKVIFLHALCQIDACRLEWPSCYTMCSSRSLFWIGKENTNLGKICA